MGTWKSRIAIILFTSLLAALASVAAAQVPAAGSATKPPDQTYRATIELWRQERQAALQTDGGWLTLVGLFWLQEGSNCAGTDPACRVALAPGSAPARIGDFWFKAGTTRFMPSAGVDVRINGRAATEKVLSTQPGRYDVVSAGTVSMFVIKRGARTGVRVRDTNSQARRQFSGTHWFPVQESYRVTATFVANAKPASVMIANVLGDLDPWPSPGYAVFTLGGRQYRLTAVLDGPTAKDLFFVFRDLTTGKDTYPGGRFLYADMPVNGQVVLDFNKAHSPPCAFTPYATCPLPPKENALAVRIEAGELNPHR